jgi:hypothetical protein
VDNAPAAFRTKRLLARLHPDETGLIVCVKATLIVKNAVMDLLPGWKIFRRDGSHFIAVVFMRKTGKGRLIEDHKPHRMTHGRTE